MNAPSWTKMGARPVDAGAAPGESGDGADRGAAAGGSVVPGASVSARRPGRWWDRHGRADADADAGAGAGADRHESEVVVRDRDGADADRADGGGEVAGRAGRVPMRALRRHWADSPRCAAEPLGSLHELLRYAREAHYNFSHIDAVRAANVVFFWMFTTPILIVAWPFLWTYVIRFHRALTAWGLTFLVAPPANALVAGGPFDWLVPDALVWTAWPVVVWQVVGGVALVFLVSTAHLVRRWNG